MFNKSILFLAGIFSLSMTAQAGDMFSFDRIEFTSVRDGGKDPDFLTVHARFCVYYNIYTNKDNANSVNCAIPLPYSPKLKESDYSKKLAPAELELSIWNPKSPFKVEKQTFNIEKKSLVANESPLNGVSSYSLKVRNDKYEVEIVTTYSLRSKHGDDDLVLLPSGENTLKLTKIVNGKLASKPTLISSKPNVLIVSIGEDDLSPIED